MRPSAYAAPPAQTRSASWTRFTVDGNYALEAKLKSICDRVVREVRAVVPENELEGIILAGGYGRGEGGVLATSAGDSLYNDMEFYVFISGPTLLNEKRYGDCLQKLAHRLEPEAGIEIEFKIISRAKLRRAKTTMHYYDMVASHKKLLGGSKLLAGCEHHAVARRVEEFEATRLLMNRCSGLLFAAERLRRNAFNATDADFVGRNLAKAQLALGDAYLTAVGKYHWSCRERHRLLATQTSSEVLPWLKEVRRQHALGVEFKLHPYRTTSSMSEMRKQLGKLESLALQVWLWLENRRLGTHFTSSRFYALSDVNKCPAEGLAKSFLASLRIFRTAAFQIRPHFCHPRERVLNSLALLLWEIQIERDTVLLHRVQESLQTDASDFPSLVHAYRRVWSYCN